MCKRARISEADVFDGHAHHAPRDVERIAAAIQHAAAPVQRRIRVRAAHGFVKRGNLVVELIAAFVEAAARAARHFLRDAHVDDATTLREARGELEHVQPAARIAVRGARDQLERIGRDLQSILAEPALLIRQRLLQHADDVLHLQGAQHIHARAGEKRADHFERRILRRGADEDAACRLRDTAGKCPAAPC